MTVKNILVVDDSEVDRLYLTEILEGAGYQVSTAVDGNDALEKVKLKMPDLVIMDVIMPVLNGFQATRMLSKNPVTAHIPVIMCTGKEVTDRAWALKQGAKECVIKPANAEELLSKIKVFD